MFHADFRGVHTGMLLAHDVDMRFSSGFWISLCLSLWANWVVADSGTELFENRVRPLLAEFCIECHGPKKQRGGLRLDSREAWERGGEGGAVIVRGRPEASRLIAAVRRVDTEAAMPPKKVLTVRQVEDLEQWIAIGAPDPRGASGGAPLPMRVSDAKGVWPYEGVKSVAMEGVNAAQIDHWVDLGLEKIGLEALPPVDWRTLARRVSYGLTGLPPAMQEVEELVREGTEVAYQAFVNRLLSSPAYGEHMARKWMDLARFSDTKGYVYAREEKRYVHASSYRRWLVESFNQDMPYDQFVRLQVAADQYCGEGDPQLAAMGFLTLGRRFLGVTPDIIDDRIDVMTRTLLGITGACARCHDHKFDPVSTKDYYAMYAMFRSSRESLEPLNARVGLGTADARAEIAAKKEALQVVMAKRREEQMARVRASVDRYLMAQRELEKYPDELFGQLLDGADLNPVFVRAWEHFLADSSPERRRVSVSWNAYSALKADEFKWAAAGVHARLREMGNEEVSPLLRDAFQKVPESIQEVAVLYQRVFADVERRWKEMVKENPRLVAHPDPEVEALRRILFDTRGPCGIPDEHISNIENFFTNAAVTELWKAQGELDRAILKAGMGEEYVTVLRDREQPIDGWVFKRGNPMQRGESVERRLPEIFGGTRVAKGSGRRELAEMIASPSNPLTARVIVNRLWAHHFGLGIVSTPSDFGVQGGKPSHPELLDFLAGTLVSRGWSLKEVHRLIVQSRAYRRMATGDGAVFDHGRRIDPDNRWLWRGPSRRLSFEELRDSWLLAAGQLSGRGVGGDPVSASNFRRSVYSYIDRDRVPAALGVWDFANPDLPVPLRLETTVPLQGLFGLNHPMVLARARELERRVERESTGILVAKLRGVYRHLYQRDPQDEEVDSALAFLNGAVESSSRSGSSGRFEQMVQMLMVSNEFLFVE